MPTLNAITGATVGVTILDENGAELVARTTEGITESPAASGIFHVAEYDATLTLTYVWDVTSGGVTFNAAETLYAGRGVVPVSSLSGIATSEDVGNAQTAIVALFPNPDTDVAVTPETLGTDGEALGVVPPSARIIATCGAWKRGFDAEADGGYTILLPPGATYTLRAEATDYMTTTTEVTV